MKLSIIIVSWNVNNDLVNCLHSIEENRPNDDFEVIVADNASTDETVKTLKSDFPQVRLIMNSKNRGFSAANNQAIRIAKGQYLLLLNPDTIVHSRSLDNLIKVLDENPTAGACGPRIIDKEGTTCPSVGYVPTFRSILYKKTIFKSLGIFRGHYYKLKNHNFDYNKRDDVEQLSGAALLVRRSLMESIGLMDESFFLYYEDVDLCLRIRKAGWRITYTPTPIITHIGARSSMQVSAKRSMMVYSSLLIYLRKYRGVFATWMFSLIFKPAVVVKEFLNVFSGIFTFLISVLLCNHKRWTKALAKARISSIFLVRYSWRFLFKI